MKSPVCFSFQNSCSLLISTYFHVRTNIAKSEPDIHASVKTAAEFSF